VVFPVGVLGAALLGLGYVLQQRVARTMPLSEVLHFRLLLDLMRRPLWWAGIAAMVVGQLLGGLALQLATVSVVEPLLSTNLLFALAFAAALARHRIAWQEVCGSVLLSAALGVFIAIGNPHSSSDHDQNIAVAALAVDVVGTVVAILVLIGKRSGLVRESVLLATGAGLLFGLQDVSTRAVLIRADDHGIVSIFTSMWPYVVVGAAVIGILLSQSAFKTARLDHSLPPIAAAEPIAGIALGVTLLGDEVSVSVVGLLVESLCLVAVIVGVAMIGRSPNLAGRRRPSASARPTRAA
jgi:drug/metabolite transporter (DMT)-like permease